MFYGLDYKVGKSDFSTMTCMREASLEVLNHMSEFLTNLYNVFLMFWYFLWTGINLMMHISLCIFANSLLFISWPICKYLESHFLKAYLKLRCGFGVLFVCLFWLGVGGEKGFLYSDNPDGVTLWFKENVLLKAIQISEKLFQVKTKFKKILKKNP